MSELTTIRRSTVMILLLLVAMSAPAQSGKGGPGGSGSQGSAEGSLGSGRDSTGDLGAYSDDSLDERSALRQDAAAAFEKWCATDPKARIAGISAGEILRIFRPALEAGFPPALIRTRVREAASKKVSVEAALTAFAQDAKIFFSLGLLAEEAGWPATAAREAFFTDASAALRNGSGEKAMTAVYSLARISRLDPKRAGAALMAASAFRSSYRCSDDDEAELAGALAASSIPARKIQSLLSSAARARSAGIDDREILSRIMEALRSGATISGIGRALTAVAR